jgi:hypothetical protein
MPHRHSWVLSTCTGPYRCCLPGPVLLPLPSPWGGCCVAAYLLRLAAAAAPPKQRPLPNKPATAVKQTATRQQMTTYIHTYYSCSPRRSPCNPHSAWPPAVPSLAPRWPAGSCCPGHRSGGDDKRAVGQEHSCQQLSGSGDRGVQGRGQCRK